jgi:DNA-binding response OmpR family regulator
MMVICQITMQVIESVTRRARITTEQPEAFEVDCFHVDCTTRTITRDGVVAELSDKDFDLAVLFFSNMGRLLSRRYIHESVWGRDRPVTSRTMDTHVSRIRSKLGLVYERGLELKAVYAHGYRLERIQSPTPYHRAEHGMIGARRKCEDGSVRDEMS